MRKEIKAAILGSLAFLAACNADDAAPLNGDDSAVTSVDPNAPKHTGKLVSFECDVKFADGREVADAPENHLELGVYVATEADLARNQTDAEFTQETNEKVGRYIGDCTSEMVGQTGAHAENKAAFDAQAAQANGEPLTDDRGISVAAPASPTISFRYTVAGKAPVELSATDLATAQKHSATVRTALGISR